MPYPGNELKATRLLRPSWAEIDWHALGRNVRAARERIGPGRKIYFVCKGDGFGFGADTVARLAVEAGVDGLCVGSPEEAKKMRDGGIVCDILLFASTLPEDATRVADLGVIVTLQNPESLQAFVELGRPVEAFVEVDSGFGRFGFGRNQWNEAFAHLRAQDHVRLRGVYSHLSSPEDHEITAQQSAVFDEALRDAHAHGFTDIEQVLASSRVMILHPRLSYTGVDPGRLIYGALDQKFMDAAGLTPMLAGIRGRIIHVQTHAPGSLLGLGYGSPIRLEKEVRLAVVPIGFWDGLNHAPPLGRGIVEGQFVPVIGRRSFQHTVLDVSGVPEARIGSTVTLMGSQQGLSISIDELANTLGLTVMELVPRLARSLPHVFLER